MSSSGRTANRNGISLENFVQNSLNALGYVYAGSRNKVFHSAEMLVYGTQVPLGKGIYGKEHFADFFLKGSCRYPKGLVIECKWQQSAGSVDEKFPFLVANIQESRVPTIVLIDGGGYKEGALAWLQGQVEKSPYLVAVYSMMAFQQAVNRGDFNLGIGLRSA